MDMPLPIDLIIQTKYCYKKHFYFINQLHIIRMSENVDSDDYELIKQLKYLRTFYVFVPFPFYFEKRSVPKYILIATKSISFGQQIFVKV